MRLKIRAIIRFAAVEPFYVIVSTHCFDAFRFLAQRIIAVKAPPMITTAQMQIRTVTDSILRF